MQIKKYYNCFRRLIDLYTQLQALERSCVIYYLKYEFITYRLLHSHDFLRVFPTNSQYQDNNIYDMYYWY